MINPFKSELTDLSILAQQNCETRGINIAETGEIACRQLLLWLQYLRSSQTTATADCLLDGISSAAGEGIACLTLGLVRPAINSLRLQIDLSLAWLYFKDHPVEWTRVQDTGEGFKLKTELIKYIGESYPKYSTRFGILKDCKTRTLEDPYRLLSAHIHGQSEFALPQVKLPRDIVASPIAQDEAIKLQLECSEYINDVFWSVYANRWASIPDKLRTSLQARFKSPGQSASFFA